MLQSSRWKYLFAALAIVATAGASRAADLELLLPKETDLIASLNVRQLLDSPLGKKHAGDLYDSMMKNNKQIQDTLAALGLNPLTDFERISLGISLDDLKSPTAVLAIEGKFDAKKIGTLLDGLTRTEPTQYKADKAAGGTVYQITTATQQTPMFVAPINGTLLMFGTKKEFVSAGFNVAATGGKSAVAPELSALLAKADQTVSLFVVANTKGKLGAAPVPDGMKKLVEQVASISATMNLQRNLQFDLAIGVAGDDVKKISDMVDAGIGLGRSMLQQAQEPEIQPLFNFVSSMKVYTKDKTVNVMGKLSGESLETWFKK